MIKWEEVEESKGAERLPSGCYVGKVVGAVDFPDKQYIRLEIDIAEGDFAGYFEERGWNGRYYYGSYKESALGLFKSMFLRYEESNPGWKFDGDEHNAAQFRGRLVGIVLREEEYEKDGEVKCSQRIGKLVAAQDVRNGSAKPMNKKLLNSGGSPSPTAGGPYDDIPFDAPTWQ